MYISLTFKMPDVLDQVDDQVEDKDELKAVKDLCSKWIEYGEYVRLDIDTEAGTCTVQEV